MEFLLGNPYSTPVGQCIEKATDGSLQNEDWTLNMEICDIINETEEGPKDAMRAVKKRLSGNRNFREVMLALTVLETCVKNCGHRFHVHIANRDFIEGVLVKIITPKTNPPAIVQDKVLSLIQAWADAFRSSPDLTGVVHIYEELKRKGVEFPMADLDALSPIHTPQRGVPEVDPGTHKYRAPAQPNTASQTGPRPAAAATADFNPTQIPPVSGPITANPEQIARLRSELDVVRGNIKVMSEMLTELVPGQEDASDLELLQELNRTCRAMQHRVVELISRVSNEEVTEELLHINDDLNNSFLRYERYERYRVGRAAQNNGLREVLNEASEEDNLIDLGPASPAVVTPRVSTTPTSTLRPPPPAAAAPALAAAASLSTQLAGLEVGADSVTGTLSSLTAHNPQDDFDMFAHTRSSSLADQRKNVKYEEPQALVGLASALDIRQQNATGPNVIGPNAELEPIDSWLITQGMIPVSQSSVMDDIEEWLCADVKGEEAEEGVTSEEFDKFLEERAKSADQASPLAPAGEPRPPVSSSSSNRRRTQQTEDNLFAL
ncbi:TOM1-like protein 2 isoform X1 [Sinocyclocheilus anshuiensis]|uniref:TOM1-like protein 2 isoform X1 n=1 Tax=Sinocyclocheilus anshuiensis TaxID=1608454 RepID=UPI0007B8CB91|nr:PREDICTED: TOM1-like protein 2 isoform X1 [Sinocyclocheilus anshuiensis]